MLGRDPYRGIRRRLEAGEDIDPARALVGAGREALRDACEELSRSDEGAPPRAVPPAPESRARPS